MLRDGIFDTKQVPTIEKGLNARILQEQWQVGGKEKKSQNTSAGPVGLLIPYAGSIKVGPATALA